MYCTWKYLTVFSENPHSPHTDCFCRDIMSQHSHHTHISSLAKNLRLWLLGNLCSRSAVCDQLFNSAAVTFLNHSVTRCTPMKLELRGLALFIKHQSSADYVCDNYRWLWQSNSGFSETQNYKNTPHWDSYQLWIFFIGSQLCNQILMLLMLDKSVMKFDMFW